MDIMMVLFQAAHAQGRIPTAENPIIFSPEDQTTLADIMKDKPSLLSLSFESPMLIYITLTIAVIAIVIAVIAIMKKKK